jgi:UDP-glucose 4-epimerase
MKVVVTGGAGFIGANLCRTLLGSDVDDVVAYDDLSTGNRDNLNGIDVTLTEGTILDRDALDAAFDGAAAVVHLAARPSVPRSLIDPVASHMVNATGTVEVLEAARRAGGPLVVVASSSSVYGGNPALPKRENMAPAPLSPYAASKLATESYALAWHHSFDLPVLAFRFFNVFGPMQPPDHAYAAVVPAFVSAALAGEPLVVHGDGRQSRDFTYVGTVAEVLTAAVLDQVSSPEPVNLAFGTRTDLLSVVALLEEILGRSVEVSHVDPRVGDVRHSQADDSRVRALFPRVEPVALKEGLAATVDWLAGVVGSEA